MTIWIMPEFDREGLAVCLFWLQGSKHDETPTGKKSRLFKPHGLFLKERKEGLTGSPNNTANCIKKNTVRY